MARVTATADLTALQHWLLEEFPEERLSSIPYRPYLTFFYPGVRNPDRFRTQPRQIVVRATSTEEVSRILAKAHDLGEPIHVRQGTGLLSLDVPMPIPPGATVLDLSRIDHVRTYRDRGYAEVGPGVSLGRTNEIVRDYGCLFPIVVRDVQWGGLISINMSGHLVDARAGKPGDLVLGLTVVLPDGKVIETGTTAMRKTVGPDLSRLFIGGQAIFGVITDIRLRLVPEPGGTAYGMVVFSELAPIADVVREMYREGLPYPSTMELVQSDFARISGMNEYVPEGHLVMLSAEADTQDEAELKADRILQLAERHGGQRWTQFVDDKTWHAVWDIRESPFHHVAPDEYLLGEAFDIPLETMREGLEACAELLAEPLTGDLEGVRAYLVSHIGAGTLHPLYTCPSDWDFDQRAEACRQIRAHILQIKLKLGATVGEQGIFPEHAEWYTKAYGPEPLAILRRMKAAFDPRDVLNRGRLDVAGVGE